MENFITRQPVIINKLICTHPKVKHLWEYGALAASNSFPTTQMERVIEIMLLDGSRHTFKDDALGQAIIDCEKYLSELPL